MCVTPLYYELLPIYDPVDYIKPFLVSASPKMLKYNSLPLTWKLDESLLAIIIIINLYHSRSTHCLSSLLLFGLPAVAHLAQPLVQLPLELRLPRRVGPRRRAPRARVQLAVPRDGEARGAPGGVPAAVHLRLRVREAEPEPAVLAVGAQRGRLGLAALVRRVAHPVEAAEALEEFVDVFLLVTLFFLLVLFGLFDLGLRDILLLLLKLSSTSTFGLLTSDFMQLYIRPRHFPLAGGALDEIGFGGLLFLTLFALSILFGFLLF